MSKPTRPARTATGTSDTGPFSIVPEWLIDSEVSDRAVRLYVVLGRYVDRDDTAFPSRRRLAERMRCSTDSVDRAMRELVALGAVDVEHRFDADRQTSSQYTLRRLRPFGTAAQGEGRTAAAPPSRTGAAPRTRTTRNEIEPAAAPARPRERNPIWDALTELFGEASTETAKSLRGKIVRSLKAADATPDQIRAAPDLWRRKMPPDATFTETALEKHWGFLLAQRQRPAPACPECGVGGGHHAEDCQRAKQGVSGGT